MTAKDLLSAKARTAFESQDWSACRDAVLSIDESQSADDDDLAMLAWASHRLGDDETASRSADRVLTRNARHLRACLVKADILWGQGARREGNLYYRGVIDIGSGRNDLSPDLADGVRRAMAIRDRLTGDIFSHLRADLAQIGYDETKSSSRFTHALDLASGRRQPYFQQPQAFFFPELPHTQFYPREMFPWLDDLETTTGEVSAELEQVLAQDAAFAPYLKTVPNLPTRSDYPLIDSMDWSACFLWKDGAETPQAARCPATMAALATAPLCQIAGRSPQIMFSQLKAGAHIKPHTGFVNTRLICHLPLIVPDGCKFRVGNETREWKVGQAWVFDDTIEHEAINQSARNRVVLIFDIWRPELSIEERALVTTLLESLDAYTPHARAWA